MAFPPSFRAVVLALLALLLPIRPSLRADLTPEQLLAAKTATALLVAPDGTGTTFCVSESGLFVTCDHVLGNLPEGQLALVISPGQRDERKYPVKIVRRLKEGDLAILKVELEGKVPALKLGDTKGLFETEQLSAFGYPFGNMLAADAKSYPAISVNQGRISSLRMKAGVLEVIQMDVQVNPGNSGGPVLDPNGNVVGIVAAGVLGSGVNFAIPVSNLNNALASPIIGLTAPSAESLVPGEAGNISVSVDWVVPPVEKTAVTIAIRGDGKPRSVPAEKGKDGKYSAKIVFGKKAANPEPVSLQVTLSFERGQVTGICADRAVAVGQEARLLGDFPVLARTAHESNFAALGKSVGKLPELQALSLDVGGTTVTVDASKALRIESQKLAQDSPTITYQAVVAVGAKEYSSPEKALVMRTSDSLPSAPILTGKVELAGVRDIPLPMPFSELAVAQDGRALLLHLKEAKKLAVFDVIELKIRGYIDLDEENVQVAGGARHVLVICPGANVIQRYSLETLKKERTINNSFGQIDLVSMGRSSPGLALFISTPQDSSSASAMIFDAGSMSVLTTLNGNVSELHNSQVTVRASADGRTFGISRRGVSPSGFIVLTYRGNELSKTYEHESCGVLVPNADGSQIFTSSSGIYTNKFVPILEMRRNGSQGTSFLPSYHPMYFLSVPQNSSPSSAKKGETASIGIYLTGSTQSLVQFPSDIKLSEKAAQASRSNGDPLTADKRYHFYPQLNLFLSIPPTNDKIAARSLNVRQLLDEKGIDYLYLSSMVPPAKVSTRYSFQLEAASKAGPVTFSLQSGPPGLSLSPEGEITWNAPAQPGEEIVLVTLKDATGQETPQTFKIVVIK